ncbi:MAG TPA: hypothetical protein VMD59_15665 [Acidimicrobiales bacterium]|nr:hypothetical protein [Acidimicrobiales bacterium]
MGRPPRRAASSTRRRLVALLAGLVCSAGLAFIPAGVAGATAGGPQVTLLPTAKLISIAADAGGDVVALDELESGAYRIFEQTPGGVSTTLPFGSLSDPGGIAADSSATNGLGGSTFARSSHSDSTQGRRR